MSPLKRVKRRGASAPKEAHGLGIRQQRNKANLGRFRGKGGVVAAGGSTSRHRELMFLSGLGASRGLCDQSGGVWGDEHVLTGFCCAARCIESLAAYWISHGGGGGWLAKWVDG